MYLDIANDECKQNNIADTGEATPNAVDNCKAHHPYIEGKCLLCDEGYILNTA